MRLRALPLLSVLALVGGVFAAPAAAQEPPQEEASFASDNMTHVANLPYEIAWKDKRSASTQIPYGTDIEFVTLPVADAPDAAGVTRLDGTHRIATAAAVSAATFTEAPTVVLATAADYADALAGSPLAVKEGGPLLLTAGDGLSGSAAAEIERLGAERAILLGGTTALSEQVEADVRAAGLATERIAGETRFETAVRILERLDPAGEVVIAEGAHADPTRGWPDALSAAGLAAAHGLPVLLVTAHELPQETAAALSEDVAATIIGGQQAVSAEVEAQIDERAGTVVRLAGDTRYQTSRAVAVAAVERGAQPATAYVATGRAFPDGLVASAAAGAANGVLLLIDGTGLGGSPETAAFIEEHAHEIDALFIAGGTTAITPDVEARLRDLVAGGSQSPTDEGGGGPQDPTPDSGSDNQIQTPEGERGDPEDGAAQAGTRDFAIAGSEYNGMQIVDITDPRHPELAANYDCGTLQGDIQVFSQGDRTYATFTSEDTSALIVESRCVQDNVELGNIVLADADGDGAITTRAEKSPAFGTYIADITDPYNPQTAGFIPVPEGSHNGTVHPSGDYFYNSNSRLVIDSGAQPGIEVYDISNLAEKQPQRLGRMPLPPQPAGLGTDSHDITFNAAGTRAYSAALSQTVIINTEDPANPTVISRFVDPAVNVEHQSDPVTLTGADGNQREFLIVQDELAGAAGNGFCPGGGLHVYDITGPNENNPQAHKVGVFFIPQFRPAGSGSGQGEAITCTSHVYRLYPEQGIMTIAWYNAGVWVVDISRLADEATDPASEPMTALGYFYFENSDTWSFKTNAFEEDGSFYGYGNDIARGLDVYRFEASADAGPEASRMRGEWLTPAEALVRARANPREPASPDNPLRCLLATSDRS